MKKDNEKKRKELRYVKKKHDKSYVNWLKTRGTLGNKTTEKSYVR